MSTVRSDPKLVAAHVALLRVLVTPKAVLHGDEPTTRVRVMSSAALTDDALQSSNASRYTLSVVNEEEAR